MRNARQKDYEARLLTDSRMPELRRALKQTSVLLIEATELCEAEFGHSNPALVIELAKLINRRLRPE